VKRTLALLIAAAVVTSPVVAEAATKAKPTKRVVTWAYTAVHGVTTPVVSAGLETPCTVNAAGCFELVTFRHETKVTFKESTGASVAIQYFTDGDYQTVQTVCGAGEVPVKKGTSVSFRTAVDPSCAGVPTQGKILLTITGKK
jgi:hypothetical protein